MIDSKGREYATELLWETLPSGLKEEFVWEYGPWEKFPDDQKRYETLGRFMQSLCDDRRIALLDMWIEQLVECVTKPLLDELDELTRLIRQIEEVQEHYTC